MEERTEVIFLLLLVAANTSVREFTPKKVVNLRCTGFHVY